MTDKQLETMTDALVAAVGSLTLAARTIGHAGSREAARVESMIRRANDRHEDLELVDALAAIEALGEQLRRYAAAAEGNLS